MTIEEFSQKYNLSMKATLAYLRENAPDYKIDVIDGHRVAVFSEAEIDAAAQFRELSFKNIDHETEHDRLSILKQLRAKGVYIHEIEKFMKHKAFPDMTRMRKPNHRIYDKKEVDAFIDKYFGNKTHPLTKKRNFSHYAALSIFFCTGRNWRLGDTITTNLHHVKEV